MKPTILVCALGAVACGDRDPGSPAPEGLYEPARRYEPRQGDGVIRYTTADPVTPERMITLRVRVPMGATGPLPAVIIMHGGGFNDVGHNDLADWGISLATAGYVAINFGNATDAQVAHCLPLMIPQDECTEAALTTDIAQGGTLPAALFTRPNDAKAILDRLDAIAMAAGVTIDPARVGVLGHSAGSHAALALAGATIQVSPTVRSLPVREPRFKAFVGASPHGIGGVGFTETSWDPIAVPVLIQTGKNDDTPDTNPPARLHAFQHLKGPDAYQQYVDAEATQHDVFSLNRTPGIEGIELTLASTAIAFFDAYILDRPEAKAWLASDALFEATDGVSTLSVK